MARKARKLWAVCGLPDFRKVGPMHHARMVRRLFSYIGEGGHIPHEWFAAEVARLENVAGDIEALADRLAGIRSWAYIAQRSDWLADPAKWAERTRAVEARLSDALHERLTQRFVDRRTAVLVRDIGARGADALPVTVAADGEVSVGPEPIGHLAGFEFRVDPTARLADKRLLLAAAERRLGEELDRRAAALCQAPDSEFRLVEEAGGLAIGWDGHILARLSPGRSLLEPAVRTARALDRLSANRRTRLRARLEQWVEAQVARHLPALKDLASAAADPGASPGIRALAAMLVDAGGHLPRRAIAAQLAGARQGRSPHRPSASRPARCARRLCPIAAQARGAAVACRIACGPLRPADAAPARSLRRQRSTEAPIRAAPPWPSAALVPIGCGSTWPTGWRPTHTMSAPTAAKIRSTARWPPASASTSQPSAI